MVINRKNIKFKITHIFMDGTRIGSEYTNDMPLRRKKI